MRRLLLIAGVSGSGKTTLACHLVERLGAARLSIDDYYRGYHDRPLEQRRLLNFDSPEAIEHELLAEHLRALLAGAPVERPVYDHAAFMRHDETVTVMPADLIVLEGLFSLAWHEIRDLATLRVFVDTPETVCFRRRIERDLHEFHRTSEDALLRYHTHVRPNQERFVLPTRVHADLVVSTGEDDDTALRQVLVALGHG